VRRETEWVRYEPAPFDRYAPTATPIYQTATFRIGDDSAFDYTRSGNPTRHVLENELARVERGTRASAFASGMAGIDAVCSLVATGGGILAHKDLYGGTYRFFTRVLPDRGVTVRFADDPLEALERDPELVPGLVFVETPTNPFQRVTDLYRLAEAARARGSLLAVDNSLMSPYLQNPLECGAHVVLHSATKFLAGHGDVTAGAVVTSDDEIGERIAFRQNACGAGLSPFDAFLLARGMKTLPLRVERQQASARLLARWLREQNDVVRVHYPGLREHPNREVHFRQARGPGSVIAFETGSSELSRRIVGALELFSPTVSFGSVGSSVSLPARMSHASIPEDVRARRCFPEDLIRLSIGIESPEDLREDLELALSIACSASGRSRRKRVPSSP
jgi:cystathionine beta-lyase